MFQLFFSMAALAQEPLPTNTSEQHTAETAATEAEAEVGAEAPKEAQAEQRAPIVIETISVTGRVPTPEVQLIINRPQIPAMSTEQLMETIDERIAEEEAKR